MKRPPTVIPAAFLALFLALSLTLTPLSALAEAPFLVRAASPGDAAVQVPAVDYPETRPVSPGEFDPRHYPKYDEVLSLLNRWAREYPNLVHVYSAGKSLEGRDIWQITITNQATGSADSKPAMYVGGNRHAGEVTARVAALHFAWTLLTGYGQDPEIEKLVDTRAFHIRPCENPDGAELYLNTAQTLRSTTRPFDQDGDGIADEDPPEDLDGDGYSRQMRRFVGPGQGDYVKDPADPTGRLMKRSGGGKGDYLVWSEGLDNDGDGKYNEDGIGGIDLHRNYPENWRPGKEATGMGWTQPGSGEYPLSEPEMRSLVLFLLEHPNVAIGQTMDTAVPMLLRPPSTSLSEESIIPADLAYYKHFDQEGRRLTGYPYAGDVYHDYNARSNRPDNPLFGHSPDWGYFQYGVIWYGDELWGNQEYVKDHNGDGKRDDLDALWMNDNHPELASLLFQDWTPLAHPGLGEVEVGGWNPKFWSQNAPAGDLLAEAVAKETRFNLLLAKSLPRLVVKRAAGKKNPDGTATITVTIANEGFLPDALKQAWLVKIVRKGTATVQLGKGLAFMKGSPGATQELGFFGGALDPESTREREVSWTVTGSGEAEIVVRSTRGGTATASVYIE